MKKTLILILSIICIISFSFTQGQYLSVADFSPAIDKKVAKMKTTEEKVKRLQSFSKLLAKPNFTQDKNAKLFADIREYALNMLKVFEFELQEEQAKNKSSNKITTTTQRIYKSDLPHLSDNFSNIDEWEVRNAILSRHNEERNNVGVDPYSYNLDLEGSATTRATILADSHKTSNLHLRNAGDGYYNYNSMLNRFSNLGIDFPKSLKGASSFSESIGYGNYKCSKSDCTQDLVTAIKKTWTNLIMKEKASKGSHYNAAVMKHFTQMGVGIAVDKSNNRYYLVIHYGVDF